MIIVSKYSQSPAVEPHMNRLTMFGLKLRSFVVSLTWWTLSVGIFAGLWEFAWWIGWADPLLMPPPHMFLGSWSDQLKFFDMRNTIGGSAGIASFWAVFKVAGWTSFRVIAGLAAGFALSLSIGLLIRYFRLFGNLMLPLISLLAPISPVAWLPVAVFLFGIGDKPAIFMVFVSVFFIMTIATLAQIDDVPKSFIDAARTLGASRLQIFQRVILPAILPGLFVTLRINLFAAWMVVLIAEAAGVGTGLGQIVMMARNTFNASLVFFTMSVIGVCGLMFDWALKLIQHRVLWWIDSDKGRK